MIRRTNAMTYRVAIAPDDRGTLKRLSLLAFASAIVLASFAASAHGDRRGWHHDHDRDRHWGWHHDRGYYSGGYYAAPPVVYASPAYAPPPVVYSPGITVHFP
jgi:hypothetical protein